MAMNKLDEKNYELSGSFDIKTVVNNFKVGAKNIIY